MASTDHVNGPPERVLDALANVLPRSAEVRPVPGSSDSVVIGGKKLVVAWAGEGGLSNVRRALATDRRPEIVVARRLSPGAREHLGEAGVAWVDETGAAELVVGSIIVSRTGRPPEKVRKPPRWTPAVLAVSEALLCGVRGTGAETEKATGLSAGSCISALRVLTDFGLLEARADRGRESARRVADRRELLSAYAKAARALRPSMSLRIGIAWRDSVAGLVEVGGEWDRRDVTWAATGGAAASVIAPHLSSVATLDVYVKTKTVAGLEAAADTVGLTPIEGGRLTLRPFPTVTTDRLGETVDNLRVAPWPRVYVDLLDAGVRGEEAAEHLWEVVNAR